MAFIWGAKEPPYLLLEDRLAPEMPARLYRDPIEIIRCDDPARVDEALARIEQGLADGLRAAGMLSYELGYAPPISDLQAGHSERHHVGKTRRVLELIGAGDVYQVNLTFPIRFRHSDYRWRSTPRFEHVSLSRTAASRSSEIGT